MLSIVQYKIIEEQLSSETASEFVKTLINRYANYNKNDADNRFVMLFYTCKAHFVNGNSEHLSVSGKAFFEEFIEMLKEKKGFDYTSEKDWEWIYTTAGGADWLESVIRQNIDSGFVKPKNTKSTCRTYEQIW